MSFSSELIDEPRTARKYTKDWLDPLLHEHHQCYISPPGPRAHQPWSPSQDRIAFQVRSPATSSCLESHMPKSVWRRNPWFIHASITWIKKIYGFVRLTGHPSLAAPHSCLYCVRYITDIITFFNLAREPHLLLLEHLTYNTHYTSTSRGDKSERNDEVLSALRWQEVLLTRLKLHFSKSVSAEITASHVTIPADRS